MLARSARVEMRGFFVVFSYSFPSDLLLPCVVSRQTGVLTNETFFHARILGSFAPRGAPIQCPGASETHVLPLIGKRETKRRAERALRRRVMSITFFDTFFLLTETGLSLLKFLAPSADSPFFPQNLVSTTASTRRTPRSPRASAGPSPSRPTSSCSGPLWGSTPASP